MTFDTAALTGNGVRQARGHRDIDNAVAILEPSPANGAKAWRAERTARPPQAGAVDQPGDVGALIEPSEFIGDGWVQRRRQFLTKCRLVGIDDLRLDARRNEETNRPGGQRAKQFGVTT